MNLFRMLFNWSHMGLSNSVNHLFGTQPFDSKSSARDNIYMDAWLFGEGFHNYHHTFPQDYRGAAAGQKQFNFMTHVIHFFEKCGWAWDLKTVTPELISARADRTGDGSLKT